MADRQAREILADIVFQATGADNTVSSIDQVIASLNQSQEAASSLFQALAGSGSEATTTFQNQLDSLNNQLAVSVGDMQGLEGVLEALKQSEILPPDLPEFEQYIESSAAQMNALAEATQAETDATAAANAKLDEFNTLAELRSNLGITGQQAGSYDELRGQLFSDGSDGGDGSGDDGGGGDDGGDGGGSGGGNPLAIGRGARAAGGLARLVGAPGLAGPLTGGADILFIQRGIQELSDTFPQLGAGVDAVGAAIGGADVALGPFALALTAAAGVIALISSLQSNYNQQLKEGTQFLNDAIAAQQEYYTDIQKLTTGQAQSRIADLKDQQTAELNIRQENEDAILRLLNDGTHNAAAQITKNLTPDEAIDYLKRSPLANDAAFKPLLDAFDKAQQSADTTGQSMTRLQQGLDKNAFAANDASAAAQKGAQDYADAQTRYEQYDKLNSQQVTETVNKLEDESAARSRSIAILQENNNATGTTAAAIEKNNEQIAKYNDENVQAANDIAHLTDVSRGLADARDLESESAKRVTAAEKALEEADKNLAQQAQETANYEKQVADAQAKASQEKTDTANKLDDDLAKLNTDASRKEEDIAQASADKIADIRTKEGEKEAAALTTYNDQISDDLTKYQEGRQKLIQDEANAEQTSFVQEQQKMNDLVYNEHQTEAKDALDHQRKLEDIRRSAQEDEQQALLDGNFSKLYADQQAEKNKETAENTRYDRQEQDLRTKLSEQEQAEAHHYEESQQIQQLHLQQQEAAQEIALRQQEAQQETAYARKLRDDKLAEDQAIDQENTAEERKQRDLQTWEERQIEDLNTAEIQKLNLISVQLGRELQLYQENHNARIALLQQELQQVEQAYGGVGTSDNSAQAFGHGAQRTLPYAEGGSFTGGNNGNGFIMGEDRSETLNIAGRSYKVGGGAAYVIPLQDGNVSQSNNGGGGFGPVQIVIQGVSDPQANARAVAEVLHNWTNN